MLIVGSSLMVYSGFRFAERAVSLGKPFGRGQPWPDASGRAPCLQKQRRRASPRSSFLLGPIAMSGSIQPARLKHYSIQRVCEPS